MEKICIVKRRKEGYEGASKLPAAPLAGGAPRHAGVLSVRLTPEQTEVVRSNAQFQRLYGGETHAITFNVYLPDTALPPRLLNTRVLSEMLGVSRRTVVRLAGTGALKSYKVGRLRRFSAADVMEYLSRSVATDKIMGLVPGK